MNEELISVIVPVYNVDIYLEKCINSIVHQTYKNLEVILIDDGSIDNSSNICDKYKELDNRIVVIHQLNEGLSCARNRGLDIAKGNFVCFIDSDDYVEPQMIQLLKKNMDNNNSDISICNYFYVTNKKNRKCVYNQNEMNFTLKGKEKFLSIHNKYSILTMPPWNKLYKKSLFYNIRFPDGKIYENSYIICDLLNKAKVVSYVLKPLYNYVYRENSIINTFSINHFNKIDAFNKNIAFFNKKGFSELVNHEKNKKMNMLIIFLSKMKRYGIRNDEVEKKYYKELIYTNKEVKWVGATYINKIYKVFGKSSISILALGLKVKEFIRK